jgi:hypothetical protein
MLTWQGCRFTQVECVSSGFVLASRRSKVLHPYITAGPDGLRYINDSLYSSMHCIFAVLKQEKRGKRKEKKK